MEEDIKRVQTRLLEMAKVVAEILNQHNIPHMLSFGTLLGAVRHGGFVPWDDDFDFLILNEHYDDAIDCLRSELPANLFLEDEESEPKYFHAWAHVKDLNTRADFEHFKQDGLYAHQGVSIDLYRLEKVKLKDLIVRAEDEYLNYIFRRMDLGLMEDDEVKQRFSKLSDIVNYFWKMRIKTDDLESINRDVYATLYTNRVFFELEDILPLRKYRFEDTEFWGPNGADAVLKRLYGDYMKLPPVEKRIPHYSHVEFL